MPSTNLEKIVDKQGDLDKNKSETEPASSDALKDVASAITDAATGAGARSYFSSLLGSKK